MLLSDNTGSFEPFQYSFLESNQQYSKHMKNKRKKQKINGKKINFLVHCVSKHLFVSFFKLFNQCTLESMHIYSQVLVLVINFLLFFHIVAFAFSITFCEEF